MKFVKMHGAGNDFVFIENFFSCVSNPSLLSQTLTDRRFGIGADGLVLIEKSDDAVAKMRIFNTDGSEAQMCGNAIRCVGKYLFEKGYVNKKVFDIETLGGIKTLKLKVKNKIVEEVCVSMGLPIFNPDLVPTSLNKTINVPLKIEDKVYNATILSMGNPHCVVFLKEDVDNLNLELIGPKFENNKIFPQKTNTEFVYVLDRNHFKMRVFERGNGETLACGTGACAVAVAGVLNDFADKNTDITIDLRGGTLKINWTKDNVFLKGGATKTFEGYFE